MPKMVSADTEAPASVWDSSYARERTPWRSSGLSMITRRLLKTYASGRALLEIGCGNGDDSDSITRMGFTYLGIDISKTAIRYAKSRHHSNQVQFSPADFFRWSSKVSFDVVYEKGFFHGLAGVRRRNAFLRRVAASLNEKGIWTTVCGSADHRRDDFTHGAIYLRDLIGPAEIHFEILEVIKGPYGLTDKGHNFQAWYGVFRRR